ncbi:hypothetical protein NW796_28500, partial [Escherichia coli]|uniref:hypothetical protein n=1 Tax=Escherichia coli TaxID=562 RepID=UPI0023AFD61C
QQRRCYSAPNHGHVFKLSQRQADNQGLRVNVLTMIVYPALLFSRLKIPCVFLLPDLQNDRAATVPAAP